MGLGVNRGGLGVARFLARAGARVLVTDLKSADALASSLRALKRFRNITYVLGEHREQDFIDTDFVVQNPGVPRDSRYLTIAREHGVPVTTDVGLFLDLLPTPHPLSLPLPLGGGEKTDGSHIIAVTGTKGKSTTSSLIAGMVRRACRPTGLAGEMGGSGVEGVEEGGAGGGGGVGGGGVLGVGGGRVGGGGGARPRPPRRGDHEHHAGSPRSVCGS